MSFPPVGTWKGNQSPFPPPSLRDRAFGVLFFTIIAGEPSSFPPKGTKLCGDFLSGLPLRRLWRPPFALEISPFPFFSFFSFYGITVMLPFLKFSPDKGSPPFFFPSPPLFPRDSVFPDIYPFPPLSPSGDIFRKLKSPFLFFLSPFPRRITGFFAPHLA